MSLENHDGKWGQQLRFLLSQYGTLGKGHGYYVHMPPTLALQLFNVQSNVKKYAIVHKGYLH